jgi:hypothetical protein
MSEICEEYRPSKFTKWKGDESMERSKDNPDR